MQRLLARRAILDELAEDLRLIEAARARIRRITERMANAREREAEAKRRKAERMSAEETPLAPERE